MLRRRSFRFAGFTALTLSAVMAVLWILSFWRMVGAGSHPSRNRMFALVAYHGSLAGVMATDSGSQSLFEWHVEPVDSDPAVHVVLGFLWWHSAGGVAVGLPLWLCSIILAVLGVITLRRSGRPMPGHCPVCGYDLRATPDRCPECGTVPNGNVPAAQPKPPDRHPVA